MSGEGWVKLYRKIIDSQVFQNEGLLKMWIWCLTKANYEDRWVPVKTGRGTTEVQIKRGQFIFGRKTAAKELRMKPTTVQDRMQKLVNMQNIVIQPVTHYSIVTLCNYDFYQAKDDSSASPSPSTNRQPTVTTKNSKNSKNKHLYVEDSIEFQLAALLFGEIRKSKPDFKRANLQSWAKDIGLMIKVDGRDPDRIREIILWCQKDSFWWKNILSTQKLRKHFDRLQAEKRSDKRGASRFNGLRAWARENIEYKDLQNSVLELPAPDDKDTKEV